MESIYFNIKSRQTLTDYILPLKLNINKLPKMHYTTDTIFPITNC